MTNRTLENPKRDPSGQGSAFASDRRGPRPCRRPARTGILLLVLALGLAACDRRSPAGPSQESGLPATGIPTSITAVSPTLGSTGGGTAVMVTGTGFQSGATLTLDGAPANAHVENVTTLYFSTPPHAAGSVDVVVTNPNGTLYLLPRGYTYALPQSFDFNGDWEGYAGARRETEIRFTIENNRLASFSCGTTTTFTFSPPPSVRDGEFATAGNDGVGVSGRIVSASAAVGMISIEPCMATTWVASKR